ncbi:MAG: type II toxin-antitoxin system Phd/YefM family antitoxin [Candidatus Peregrinibacteria bacterium]
MTSIPVTTARTTLYRLIQNLQSGEAPVLITGKKGNAVLVSEQDWRAIEETLFLVSIPGMSRSIQKGMKEPVSRCAKTIDL